MFIYNLKLNKKALSRLFIAISVIVIISIICFSVYLILLKKDSGCIKSSEIFEINESNYTNILKASNENIDDYLGCKIKVTGYVYRLLDFNKNQFVVARDMQFGENSQSLIVGFLCDYKNANAFPDGCWVEIIGEIVKGNFNGEIAMLKVISITETNTPENILVSPPDNTYIPTSNMF